MISEYTGGGFGSKITSAISAIIPALLSKKTGAPVMMRISREEEHYIGRARPSIHGRLKVGFTKDGRITAIDMFVICDNGPYDPQGDANQSGPHGLADVPAAGHALARRFGADQHAAARLAEPAGRIPGHRADGADPVQGLAQAGHRSGGDPPHQRAGRQGAHRTRRWPTASALYVTSAFIKEALDKGHEAFRWDERKAQPKRSGTKARGIGVATSCFVGGSVGFDGLFVIKPDGKLYIQSGIGNLGTESVSDCHRVTAEMLGVPWEKVRNHLGPHRAQPAVELPLGRQPDHARHDARGLRGGAWMPRTSCSRSRPRISAASRKITRSANERVFRKGGGAGMTLAQAAKRAIELGGIYDGHELPKGINKFTVASAKALAGQGLLAVARDTMPRDGQTHSFVAGFAEVEVDLETGKYRILDYPGSGRRGHRDSPARARRAGAGPLDARHRPRDRPEVGLRSALRPAAGQAVPSHQAAHDSGRAREHGVGRAWAFPIPKRPSARAASASLRWARAAWRF